MNWFKLPPISKSFIRRALKSAGTSVVSAAFNNTHCQESTDDENSNHSSSTAPQASTGQFGIQQRHTLQSLLDTHVNPMQYMPVASNSMMPPIDTSHWLYARSIV